MVARKPRRQQTRALSAVLPVPELTVAKVASTWKTLAAIIASTAVIASAALWILSTQFARVADVKRIEDTQIETNHGLKTRDLEINTVAESAREGVKEIKVEVVELRKEQRQTSENLIRLMERFSVKPVEAP